MGDDSVRVALRVRPLVNSEKARGCQNIINVIPEQNQVQIRNTEKAFTFNHVFDPSTEQEEFYNSAIRKMIDSLFKGYNVTILAYGQTGSGKTHSMGTNYGSDNSMGVIPRAVNDIFNIIETKKNDWFFKVSVSFMEIYQEQLYDLLAFDKQRIDCMIDIREKNKEIKIIGITEKEVKNSEAALELLVQGSDNRATGATAMNHQASRSHAIFTLTIHQQQRDDPDNSTTAKFHLVDLAGSERNKKTQATGERFKEGVNINKGLLALGNIISQLGEGNSNTFVNYRDSKLTRLLQDSLRGNSIILMIACISPADYNLEETLSTLRYADRAKKIKNKPIINQDPKTAEINRLNKIINDLPLQMLGNGTAFSCPPEHIEFAENSREKICNGLQKILEHLDNVIKENIEKSEDPKYDGWLKLLKNIRCQIAELLDEDKKINSEILQMSLSSTSQVTKSYTSDKNVEPDENDNFTEICFNDNHTEHTLRQAESNDNQQNVFKRKLEEAHVVNKRLKEALEMKKKSRLEKATNSKEEIRNWLQHELNVLHSIVDAECSVDELIKDREVIVSQLKKLETEYCQNSTPEIEKQITAWKEHLDLRNAQISDFQQKLLESEQDAEPNSRWQMIQSMDDAKTALSMLFKTSAENEKKYFNKCQDFNNLMEKYDQICMANGQSELKLQRNLNCYNIAEHYFQVKQYELAKKDVSEYLKVKEDSAPAHKLLGIKDSSTIQYLMERAVEKYPDHPAAKSECTEYTVPTTVDIPSIFNPVTNTIASKSLTVVDKNASVVSNTSHNCCIDAEVEHDPIPDFMPVIPIPAKKSVPVVVKDAKEDEKVLFECVYCHTQMKNYRHHTKTKMHRENIKNIPQNELKGPIIVNNVSNYCTKCECTFSNIIRYRHHLTKCLTPNKSPFCHLCEKVFANSSTLRRHVRMIHSSTSAATGNPIASIPAAEPLSEMFKPAPGSWECGSRYTKIEIKTGKEDETVLYQHPAKLLRYDPNTKEWEERGLGDIKLLKHQETSKLRLVMHREKTVKLCLNHFVTKELEISPKDDKSWTWHATDYSDGEIKYILLACRFKTSDIAEEFKSAVDKAIANIDVDVPVKVDKSESPEELQVVYELTVSPEEKAEALRLKLPENLFSYEQKKDCPGCLGCREPEVPLFDAPKESKTTTTPSASIKLAPPKLNTSSLSTTTASSSTSSGFSTLFKTTTATPATTAITTAASASTSSPSTTVDFGKSEASKPSIFGGSMSTSITASSFKNECFLNTDNIATFSSLATKAGEPVKFKTNPNFVFASAGQSVFGSAKPPVKNTPDKKQNEVKTTTEEEDGGGGDDEK